MNQLFKAFLAIVLNIVFVCSFVSAELRPLVEGKDYQVMSPKGSKTSEVMEFFSYACYACYKTETLVEEFKKDNQGVTFVPVPTDLGRSKWELYVKAYYLGELLKVLDKSHSKIFHQIHIEKKYINKEKDLKALFLSLGVEEARYDRAYGSVALDMRIRKAKQLTRKYQVVSTPTFVANQRYKLDSKALNTPDMIKKALKDLSVVKI